MRMREYRVQNRRLQQVKKGPLRVHAGHHRFAGDFFSIRQHHAGHRAAFRADLRHFRVGANLRARFFGRFGKRARNFAQPASRKCGRTNRMSIGRRA